VSRVVKRHVLSRKGWFRRPCVGFNNCSQDRQKGVLPASKTGINQECNGQHGRNRRKGSRNGAKEEQNGDNNINQL